MKMKVPLYWFLNSSITPSGMETIFNESDGNPDSEKYLCKKWDEKYDQMKEDLLSREIYFIHYKKDCIEVWLRPKEWRKKK